MLTWKRFAAHCPRGAGPALVLLVTLVMAVPSPGRGQSPSTPASSQIGLILRQLDGIKRVLLVAAHPDDEDTALLATLARGRGAEVAYFAFTRGEGGQNLIGLELGEGLGIVRTGELLAARSLDGARQFFSRAYDFGYSKSADETFRHWPRDTLLSDLVRVVRRLRPQVIVSVFSGTPADGHGQHQAAGILAREAFEVAGDPDRFPDHLDAGLEPWTPLKLYRRTFFDPQAATLGLPTGRLDPLLGRSHHQLAMDSRSQHRSQDFGTAQSPGPRTTGLSLLESRVGGTPGDPLLAGIDTTLIGLTRSLPADAGDATAGAIEEYRREILSAGEALTAANPAGVVAPLARARARLTDAISSLALAGVAGSLLEHELDRRAKLVETAILIAAGVRVERRVHDDVLVPGQNVLVEARVWSGGDFRVEARPPSLTPTMDGELEFEPAPDDEPPADGSLFGRFFRSRERMANTHPDSLTQIEPDDLVLWRYRLGLPQSMKPTLPYYLEQPRSGDVYTWPADPDLQNEPFDPAPLWMTQELTLSGPGLEPIRMSVSGPVVYRGVDKASGEFWRPVHVAPRLSVRPSTTTLVWAGADDSPRDLTITIRSEDPEALSGTLALDTPDGWIVEPASTRFSLESEGAEARVAFQVQPTATGQGTFSLRPIAQSEDGGTYSLAVEMIDYPHIDRRLFGVDASVRVLRIPVHVADRRIGYVMGSGDDGAEVIRQLGLGVEMIEPDDWTPERLERYDTIVLGVRTYEVRPDLAAATPTLLDWVRAGGALIVQYNKYEFMDGEFAPYPIQLGRPAPRVTDETADVRILMPDLPLFNTPNRLDAEDFEGWVQERGLYIPSEWDDRYLAPIEMADEGESPLRGSVLVARYGEGLYAHTSLSFFRQLPAGVPGAYRLFANLISLDPADWPAPAVGAVRPAGALRRSAAALQRPAGNP
jgi:LmbE family N-acetylglucosaminyl deacetylase